MGDDACLPQSDNQSSVSGSTWWKERLDSSKLSSDLHTHPQVNVIKNFNLKNSKKQLFQAFPTDSDLQGEDPWSPTLARMTRC